VRYTLVIGKRYREDGLVSDKRRCYLSYLLRLWRIESVGEPLWRASLESAHTGKRVGFASLDALFSYLRQEVDAAPAPGKDQGEREGPVQDTAAGASREEAR
jgi:hypothetical protein